MQPFLNLKKNKGSIPSFWEVVIFTDVQKELFRFDALKKILQSIKPPGPPDGANYVSTCVFLLLYGQDEPQILCVQKSDTEGYPWRNQVALPGGHIDPSDSGPIAAVYRELKEELNIPQEQVRLIGSAGHFQTINNKDIQVFVGIWNGQGPISYDSAEIARVLAVPVKHIAAIHQKNNFHNRIPGIAELVYPFDDVIIWGVTARILHHFIEVLFPFMFPEKDGVAANAQGAA